MSEAAPKNISWAQQAQWHADRVAAFEESAQVLDNRAQREDYLAQRYDDDAADSRRRASCLRDRADKCGEDAAHFRRLWLHAKAEAEREAEREAIRNDFA